MLKKFSIFIALLLLGPLAFAQLERVGTPVSWSQSLTIDVENEILAQPDVQSLLGEDDAVAEDRSSPFRFAFARDVDWNLMNSGTWINLPNGDRLWMMSIEDPGAFSIAITLDNLNIPAGGRLYIYSEDHQDYLGPITESDNRDFELGLPHIKGSKIIAEYYEPIEHRGESNFTIAHVAGAYKNMAEESLSLSACHVPVDLEHASVAMANASSSVIRILVDHGQRYATGVLVNNATNDGTPYVLMSVDAILGTPSSFVFQFAYNSDCRIAQSSCNEQSICGAEMRMQDAEHNVALVQLLKSPKTTWGAYYSGWQLQQQSNGNLRCLQHAKGLPLTITKYGGELMPVMQNGHMMHGLSELESGQTDAGSVGSPLFDDQWNLIGLFRGGNTQCDGNGGMDRFVLLTDFWSSVRNFLDPAHRYTDKIPGFMQPLLETAPESDYGLIIYPNPASDYFSLTCESANTIHTIELFDAQGKLLRTYRQNTGLAIGDIPAGVYTARVNCSNGSHTMPLHVTGQ